MIRFEYEFLALIGVLVAIAEILGVLSAIHAIMHNRTAQGAIAWALSLLMFPLFALPLYWVLGRRKFQGYFNSRRSGNSQLEEITLILQSLAPEHATQDDLERWNALVQLAKMPFTKRNHVEILLNGEETFRAIFEAIRQAESYVLVQFFIIHDDQLGRQFQALLVEQAKRGVRIHFIYDEIGCHRLPTSYLRVLREAGISVTPFLSNRGWNNRFQINFRNHRKIVVVDGSQAFVGGLNVGDEYMGRNARFGPWRDTHVRMAGPSVLCVQLSFLEDWFWATRSVPWLNWTPRSVESGQQKVLVLPSGPADELETCGLFFVHTIHAAQERIWISSPYFVPDPQVISALQLAALRGVDVRVMLPDKVDHLLVYLSSFSFLEEMEKAGVKVYRYLPGFLHQKALIVDDDFAAIGTANLDNRSFRLNFEITIAVVDMLFAEQARAMLKEDLANCRLSTSEDLHRQGFLFHLGVRISRLLAPIQ